VDGVLQDEDYQRRGLDIVVVADKSGSMGEKNRMECLKIALRQLVEKLGDKDRIALVTFNDESLRKTALKRCNAKHK
jgi:Mg-chelatase subunit ChlD